MSRDHVPSKCLLRPPYPKQLPAVEVCKSCNQGFSRDEEYLVAFLGCVIAGSSDPSKQVIPSAARVLQRNEKLRAQIDRSKREYKTVSGESRCAWYPEAERVNRVLLKNARGHALFEYGEPIREEPKHVWSLPLQSLTSQHRAHFENNNSGGLAAWPEVGSRMMTRVISGQDMVGSWVVVQDGVYRYSVEQQGRLLVKSVLLEYLATEVYWER
jgi:hypothetical protein